MIGLLAILPSVPVRVLISGNGVNSWEPEQSFRPDHDLFLNYLLDCPAHLIKHPSMRYWRDSTASLPFTLAIQLNPIAKEVIQLRIERDKIAQLSESSSDSNLKRTVARPGRVNRPLKQRGKAKASSKPSSSRPPSSQPRKQSQPARPIEINSDSSSDEEVLASTLLPPKASTSKLPATKESPKRRYKARPVGAPKPAPALVQANDDSSSDDDVPLTQRRVKSSTSTAKPPTRKPPPPSTSSSHRQADAAFQSGSPPIPADAYPDLDQSVDYGDSGLANNTMDQGADGAIEEDANLDILLGNMPAGDDDGEYGALNPAIPRHSTSLASSIHRLTLSTETTRRQLIT